MNARDVIAESWTDEAEYTPESILAALRAAAGGADRVVLAWEPTPCPESCYGTTRSSCKTCNGSGFVGDTVSLQTLAKQGSTCSCVVAPEQLDEPCAVVPLFRLVAVSPEPPETGGA